MPPTVKRTSSPVTVAEFPISQENGEMARAALLAARSDLPDGHRLDPTMVDMAAVRRNIGCYGD